jgi:hypothetical protein
VHLLFLDESGKPSDPSFAVGGVAVRADDWASVRDGWNSGLATAGWPPDKEIKWHATRTGEVPPALADALFSALSRAPITCFVVVLRPLAGRKAHAEFFASDDETYATALTFLAERFNRFLAREDSHGVIVLDSRERETDDRLRRYFDRIHREGTRYTELSRIVDSLLLGPSHFSLGLQVADLVVGATLAAERAPGDATRWFKQLQPCFARHPDSGEVDGVGLKFFPEEPTGEAPARKLFTP